MRADWRKRAFMWWTLLRELRLVGGPKRSLSVAVAAAVVLGMLVGIPPASAAFGPCVEPVNPVVCENSKPGTPASVWDISGAGDPSIQGYATDISVNLGDQVTFKIDTDAADYAIKIYRLGWYDGDGAREWATISPSASLPQQQPACITDPTTEIFDCGNWAPSASWIVPADGVSGVFIARLIRSDTGGESHIPFIVRDDSSTSDLFFQTSDTTWQAYNNYGGSDFYVGGANGRGYKLSYNRPFATRADNSGRDYLFSNEYPMIRFLEQNGYDISYTTGVDSDRRGELIQNHKVFLSVGHDEYWSGAQRAHVEAARDAGVNLAFFSGNEMYWKVRWEESQDGDGTPYRTLVCYKETWAGAKIDPAAEWTGTWRDPQFSPPSDGGLPENALTGTAYKANHNDMPIEVPAEQGKNRFWRGTDVAAQAPGQVATLAEHTVGYESNEDLDNGFRPAGLIRMSTSVGYTPEYLFGFGNPAEVAAGETTHHVTLYRAGSGALVFSAGTIQWAWGLDTQHDGNRPPVDEAMQQATVNLFADMGVQPDTLMSWLTPAAPSTDTQAPTAVITAPAAGTTVARGSVVTVSGTASDVGGGRVAGIEVSVDGGTRWHPADGTDTWSYQFYASALNDQQVLVRAVDDSANLGEPSAPLTLDLTGEHTLFGDRVPEEPVAGNGDAYELGVRFSTATDGLVTGIRFYKGAGNTGEHHGRLWTSTGTLLAEGTFTGESATGWQQLVFSSPVPVAAGVEYVASYFAPNGHYPADLYAFSAGDWQSGPLTTPRSVAGQRSGLYTPGSGFPTESYKDTNYYVDVTFAVSAATPPVVTSVTPLPDATGVPVSTTLSAAFSKEIDPGSIEFAVTDDADTTIAGTTSYEASTQTATFTPAEPLSSTTAYSVSLTAEDDEGVAMSSPMAWSFVTDLDQTLVTLFPSESTPDNLSVADGNAVELGVRFVAGAEGSVVGMRFYRGPANTGSHSGSLWSGSGQLLARLTFDNPNGIGWQIGMFDSPVPLTPGETYVVSYHAPNGYYSSTSTYFDSEYVNGALSAPGGTNGVYRYGGSSFPSDSWQSTNYWVDPIFAPDAGSDPDPDPDPTGSPSDPPRTGPSSTPSPDDPSPTPEASPSGWSDPSPTPSPSPEPSVSPSPEPSPDPGGATIFGPTATPDTVNWPDHNAIEVGVRFTADTDGVVTGVRFYKGWQNGGTHVGSLWTETGTLLATAQFADETANGWQTVTFSQPVAISAGSTYVASYFTPVGFYAVTLNTFSGVGLDQPPLHVPASGAVYRYGGGFPSDTSVHNYWVDVVFEPDEE
ncbi:DUF4082 domain-containing protein [Solwaraspora sp. WMMB335]|uniref:DUF4082 domain-containing protein n=1 Tax=Solwaraspora sp. WMMB335 TaxID=3404118 RepID=UPI003B950275